MYTYSYSTSDITSESVSTQPAGYVYAVKHKSKDRWMTSLHKRYRGYTDNLKDASLYGSKNGPAQLLLYRRDKYDYEIVRYELKQVPLA